LVELALLVAIAETVECERRSVLAVVETVAFGLAFFGRRLAPELVAVEVEEVEAGALADEVAEDVVERPRVGGGGGGGGGAFLTGVLPDLPLGMVEKRSENVPG
jgi:hypothetical protein